MSVFLPAARAAATRAVMSPASPANKQGTGWGSGEEAAEGIENAVFKQLCLLFC